MLYTTFALLHKHSACVERYRFLAQKLGGITKYGKDTPIPLAKMTHDQFFDWMNLRGFSDEEAFEVWDEAGDEYNQGILEICWLDDTLWALRATTEPCDKLARLFACDCAERVLPIFERKYPDDKRPRQAIEVARRFAQDQATNLERDAASDAAYAARAAAYAAYGAGAAAGDAARAAAYAAYAAGDAVYAAYAAREAELAWQRKHLLEMLQSVEVAR